MRRTLIFLLLGVHSARADVLFRDERQGHGYIFESDEPNVEGTASRDKIIELASEWAASFYENESLEVADVELRIKPLRFWLVTFKKPGTDEAFYAAVLPDGTIVEAEERERI